MGDTKLWTVSEISAKAKTSTPVVTADLREGRLDGEHIGRMWVVTDAAARDYIKRRLALVKARGAM